MCVIIRIGDLMNETNCILNLISQENVTFIFSIIGASYAALSVLFKIISYLKKPIINIQLAKNGYKNKMLILLSIENISTANLSIYEVRLKQNDKIVVANKIPEIVLTITKSAKGEEKFRKEYFSLEIPFIVYSRAMVSGYIYFSNDQDIQLDLDKPVILEIVTNSHKVYRKQVLQWEKE